MPMVRLAPGSMGSTCTLAEPLSMSIRGIMLMPSPLCTMATVD